jgi:hypothetical protein
MADIHWNVGLSYDYEGSISNLDKSSAIILFLPLQVNAIFHMSIFYDQYEL